VTGSVATGFVFTPSVALLGVQTLTYTVLNTGLCTTTGTRRVTVTPAPVASFAPLPQAAYCMRGPNDPAQPAIPLVGTPAGGTFSGPGVSGSVAAGFVFTPTAALVGVQTLTYTVLSTGMCTTSSVRRITVTAGLAASFAPIQAQRLAHQIDALPDD
jgi:hypothetical protein